MSLLREALKKAERAQEDARRGAGVQPLALEPEAAVEPVASAEIIAASEEPFPSPEAASLESEQVTSEGPSAAPTTQSNAKAERVWEPNPKAPFYFVLSALVVAAAGGVAHFWLQLRAPSPIAHLATPRPAPHAPSAQPKPAATAPLLATTEEALASLARPGANGSAQETPPMPAPEPKAAPAAAPIPRTDPVIGPRPSPRSETPLRADDPRRLKEIPGAEPSLGFLSSLGSEHARNARWSEARDAFAIAAADDPENPDVAFNLAVSYDRLQRKREALEHYQRALRLRQDHPAQFPADAARERMRYLARSSAAERR